MGEVPKYYHVTAVRSRAAIDDQASEVFRKKPWTCSECRGGGIERHERIILEEGSWSGEDVFYARRLPGTILVSARFEEFYKANNIEGAVLVPTTDYRYDMHDFSWMREYQN